jgi:hypothetical protein
MTYSGPILKRGTAMKVVNLFLWLEYIIKKTISRLFSRRRTVEPTIMMAMCWMLLFLCQRQAPAASLVQYDLSSSDYPSVPAHISETTLYADAYGRYIKSGNAVACDNWSYNYYWFSFKVEWGYAINVTSFQFTNSTYGGGPTQFAVELTGDGRYGDLTGGWLSVPGYGTGVDTAVMVTPAATVTGITGHVLVQVYGRNATISSVKWYQKSMLLNGSVYALPSQPPHVPRGLSASDGTYTDRVLITWRAADGATGYDLWRAITNNSTAATKLGTAGAATNYSDLTSSPGVTNYYWVKATNAFGNSSFSVGNAGHVSPMLTLSPSLTNLTSAAANGKTIAVTGKRGLDGDD